MMHVVYTGQQVRVRPFRDFAEIDSILAEDYAVPDPFRGPRWWPDLKREAEFGKSGMLGHDAYSMLAIDRLDTGELVGIAGCGSYVTGSLSVNFGTYILSRHRRLGLGIEAKQLNLCRLFESYPIEAVRANTMEHHRRACASMAACGMRYCGRLRAIEWESGSWFDEVQYVIFREEWERLPIRRQVQRG